MTPPALWSDEVSLRLALSLLHSLWQGALLAFAAAVSCWLWRRRAAGARYGTSGIALLALGCCLPVNFWLLSDIAAPPGRDPASESGQVLPAPALPANAVPVVVPIATLSEPPLPVSPPVIPSVPSPVAQQEVTPQPAEPVVADAPPAVSTDWKWLTPWVAGLYCAGVALMLVRLLAAMYGGQRLRAVSQSAVDSRILESLRVCVQRAGLRTGPAIAHCVRVSSPVLLGVLRPIILLPPLFSEELTHSQMEAILLHELAHLRRYDHLALVLQRLLEVVLFYHPAAWWLSRRVSVEREICCDDLVLRWGSDACSYAEAIVRMSEVRRRPAALQERSAAVLAAAGENPSRLRERVLRILDEREEGPRIGLSWRGLAVLIGAGILVTAAVAQRPEETPVESVAQVDPQQEQPPAMELPLVNPEPSLQIDPRELGARLQNQGRGGGRGGRNGFGNGRGPGPEALAGMSTPWPAFKPGELVVEIIRPTIGTRAGEITYWLNRREVPAAELAEKIALWRHAYDDLPQSQVKAHLFSTLGLPDGEVGKVGDILLREAFGTVQYGRVTRNIVVFPRELGDGIVRGVANRGEHREVAELSVLIDNSLPTGIGYPPVEGDGDAVISWRGNGLEWDENVRIKPFRGSLSLNHGEIYEFRNLPAGEFYIRLNLIRPLGQYTPLRDLASSVLTSNLPRSSVVEFPLELGKKTAPQGKPWTIGRSYGDLVMFGRQMVLVAVPRLEGNALRNPKAYNIGKHELTPSNEGADLVLADGEPNSLVRHGMNLAVVKVDAEKWNTVSVRDVMDALVEVPNQPLTRFQCENDPPTYFYRTLDGSMGIVRFGCVPRALPANPMGFNFPDPVLIEFRALALQGDSPTQVQLPEMGPVLERILYRDSKSEGDRLFDLDATTNTTDSSLADLTIFTRESDLRVRQGMNLAVAAADEALWKAPDAATISRVLENVAPVETVRLGGPEDRRIYCFRTAQGAMGILRLEPVEGDSGDVLLKYRLIRRTVQAQPAPALPAAPSAAVSETLIRVLGLEGGIADSNLDLDTGELKAVPGTMHGIKLEPLQAEGIDLYHSSEQSNLTVRTGLDLKTLEINPSVWDLSTEEVLKSLPEPAPSLLAVGRNESLGEQVKRAFDPVQRVRGYLGPAPRCYLYQTREGAIGLLQFLPDFDNEPQRNDPNTVRVRMRILQRPAAPVAGPPNAPLPGNAATNLSSDFVVSPIIEVALADWSPQVPIRRLDLGTGTWAVGDEPGDLGAVAGESDRRVRTGFQMIAVPATENDWNSPDPDRILKAVAGQSPQLTTRMGGGADRNIVFFQTASGAVGILRVREQEGRLGVWAEYRLLRKPVRPARELNLGEALTLKLGLQQALQSGVADANLDLDTGELKVVEGTVHGMLTAPLALAGVDLYHSGLQSNLNMRAGLNLKTLPAEPADWDRPLQELQKLAKGLADGNPPPGESLLGPAPKTYFYQTREGTVGILQFLPAFDDNQERRDPNFVRVRMKIIQRPAAPPAAPRPAPAVQPVPPPNGNASVAPQRTPLMFGEVFERVIQPAGAGQESLDLESGEWKARKNDTGNESDARTELASLGVDLYSSAHSARMGVLSNLGMRVTRLIPGEWDLPASEVISKVREMNLSRPNDLWRILGPEPGTFLFITREESVGVLEILAPAVDVPGRGAGAVRLRYKFVVGTGPRVGRATAGVPFWSAHQKRELGPPGDSIGQALNLRSGEVSFSRGSINDLVLPPAGQRQNMHVRMDTDIASQPYGLKLLLVPLQHGFMLPPQLVLDHLNEAAAGRWPPVEEGRGAMTPVYGPHSLEKPMQNLASPNEILAFRAQDGLSGVIRWHWPAGPYERGRVLVEYKVIEPESYPVLWPPVSVANGAGYLPDENSLWKLGPEQSHELPHGSPQVFDLDTGKFVNASPPGEIGTSAASDPLQSRRAYFMKVVSLPDRFWETVPISALKELLNEQDDKRLTSPEGFLITPGFSWGFRTSAGQFGVLRLEFRGPDQPVILRYKLMQPVNSAPPSTVRVGERVRMAYIDPNAAAAIPPAADPVLGPETVKEILTRPYQYFDLDTGEFLKAAPPGDIGTSLFESTPFARRVFNTRVAEVPAKFWESATLLELKQALVNEDPKFNDRQGVPITESRTWAFFTAVGQYGVLRIEQNPVDPAKSMTLRYKLMSPPQLGARAAADPDEALQPERSFAFPPDADKIFDFETGRFVNDRPPGDLGMSLAKNISSLRRGFDMKVVAVPKEVWTQADVLRIKRELDNGVPIKDTPNGVPIGGKETTWVFQTREGTIGIMLLVEGTAEALLIHIRGDLTIENLRPEDEGLQFGAPPISPGTVFFRYRLIKKPAGPAAAADSVSQRVGPEVQDDRDQVAVPHR